jgi:hypothetical protein
LDWHHLVVYGYKTDDAVMLLKKKETKILKCYSKYM